MTCSRTRDFVVHPVALVLLLAIAVQVGAGSTLFYQAGTDRVNLNMNNNSTRQTQFRAFNDVTLTSLGAWIDPLAGGDNEIQWTIRNSDATGTFGSVVFTTGVVTLTDVGFTTYDTAVNVSLTAGNYYILELQNLTGLNLLMRQFNESDQHPFPFVTTDNNFQVINGAQNNVLSNSILPAFSVDTAVVTQTPEPATLTMFGFGLAGFAAMAWRQRGRRHL